MSLFVDLLAERIQDTVNDGDASRQEWQQALDQVFGNAEPATIMPGSYVLTWEIDEEGESAAQAAALVWRRIFRRRGRPSPDEACAFTVTDGENTVEIDLSDEQYAPLFT